MSPADSLCCVLGYYDIHVVLYIVYRMVQITSPLQNPRSVYKFRKESFVYSFIFHRTIHHYFFTNDSVWTTKGLIAVLNNNRWIIVCCVLDLLSHHSWCTIWRGNGKALMLVSTVAVVWGIDKKQNDFWNASCFERSVLL